MHTGEGRRGKREVIAHWEGEEGRREVIAHWGGEEERGNCTLGRERERR